MSRYILRLDDACEKRDVEKWNRIEELCDRYKIEPLVGVIPNCHDPKMAIYNEDLEFWARVNSWSEKKWTIALHGYEHVYDSDSSGINPVNSKSEFAGHSLSIQKEKIRKGISVLRSHGIEPKVFFAPSHTFDENTIIALKEESDVVSISDTPANKPYLYENMIFVPQQTGKVRKLPFHTVTFCYHPNQMKEKDFQELETFMVKYRELFINYETVIENNKIDKLSWLDKIVMMLYFSYRKFRNILK